MGTEYLTPSGEGEPDKPDVVADFDPELWLLYEGDRFEYDLFLGGLDDPEAAP